MALQEVPKRYYRILLIVGLVLLSAIGVWSTVKKDNNLVQVAGSKVNRPELNKNFGNMPLRFEAKESDKEFISRGDGYTLSLTNKEAVLALSKDRKAKDDKDNRYARIISPDQEAVNSTFLHMQLVGANETPQVTGEELLPGKSNYLLGNDPSEWKTDISNYKKVRYESVYSGIDMVYYGNQRQLEYDLVVSPAAKPEDIAIRFSGADRLSVDEKGDLLIDIDGKQVKQHRPVVYQEIDGIRQPVAGSYVIKDKDQIGFDIAAYDKAKDLVIDPVMNYATFIGGGGPDEATNITSDSDGNIYVVGRTLSNNFPHQRSIQSDSAGGSDAVIMKFDSAGTLVYSTYLGGLGEDYAAGIALDSQGNVYVTGDTTSTNFPVSNAVQTVNASGQNGQDAFVTKINAAGNSILYSTYIGGSKSDAGFGIAVDSNGSAYVIGTTVSTDFPVKSALQPKPSGQGSYDAFVLKLNQTGNSLDYSTYLGGSQSEFGIGIAVDGSGNAYVTGDTRSADFPTKNAFQPTYRDGEPFGDAFVAKIDPSGNSLIYSTYLGGSNSEFGEAIVVDSQGNAYVTGGTNSADFPTMNQAQKYNGGFEFGDAFITKINPSGTGLVFSTYLGGQRDDYGRGLVLDSQGNIYVTGTTFAIDFPVVSPIQNSTGGENDAFLAKLSANGQSVLYATYIGGEDNDYGTGITLDKQGNIYISGRTASRQFPTMRATQTTFGGGAFDAFIAKISDSAAPVGDFTIALTPSVQTVGQGSSTSFTLNVQPQSGFAQPVTVKAIVSPSNGNITTTLADGAVTPGTNATLTVNTAATTPTGTYTVTITGSSGLLTHTATATVNVAVKPDFSIAFGQQSITAKRGQSGQIAVNLNRTGGFTGNVTVSVPSDLSAIKTKITPATQSTTGSNLTFNYKVKKKAQAGTSQIIFSGRDSNGNVRTGTLEFIIQ